MIKSKEDLKEFLNYDKKALGISRNKPKFFGDEIWKFQILLRKCEYYKNTNKKLRYYFSKFRFNKKSLKLGFSIPLNVFNSGLSIAHYGTIVVNSNAKIGENCRIQECVTIGSTNGSNKAPILGNNVFIGSGARIIGDIEIGNNIAIGAGAVVVNSFKEDGITIAGVPAKKISNNDSKSNLNKNLFR